jgi:uncharacterized membrane protein (UPF0136 family)
MTGSAHLNYGIGGLTFAGGIFALFKYKSQSSFVGGAFIGG